MGLKLFERKPLHTTVVAKSARRVAMLMRGLDPDTPAETAEKVEKKRQAARWLSNSCTPE